jgi:hypothetical protein
VFNTFARFRAACFQANNSLIGLIHLQTPRPPLLAPIMDKLRHKCLISACFNGKTPNKPLGITSAELGAE